MAYTKSEWKDHVTSRPNTYSVAENPDGTKTLTPAGEVLQKGSPLSAERFNHMEQGIAEAHEGVAEAQRRIEALDGEKASTEYVNDAINSVSAYYITYDVNGNPFPTFAALSGASAYYYAGKTRVPTKNDYALVLADETHDNAACRYVYTVNDGETTGQWALQYVVNDKPLTEGQLAALNSGFTAADKSTLDTISTPATEEKAGVVKVGKGLEMKDGVLMVTGNSDDVENLKNLCFPKITITSYPDTAVTLKSGSKTITATPGSDGVIDVHVPTLGEWTVSVTYSGVTTTKTVLCDIIGGWYYVKLTKSIYGASWDGASSTSWARTDDSSGFSDPVPYVSGASNYGSPFDNCYPWSDMQTSERTGGTMVSIPKFWYKITQSGSGMKIQIADGETEGFSVSPAHMDRGDGKGERDVVYIGRYHCGSSAYKSVSGQTPKVSITRSSARSSIHNLGLNIWQSDFAMRFTIWLLYIVEFANWDSQSKIGYGCGNNSGTQSMGYTDSMPYHTGTTQSSRTTYGLGTQYRYIEGLWDNVYDWCDGCYYNSNGLNIINNPNNYSDSSNGVSIGTPSSGYPSAFSVRNTSGIFPLFIPTAANGSSSTYSCDNWNFSASSPCLYVGGYYGQNLYHGLFCVSCDGTSNSYGNIGCRLQELP